MRSDRLETAPGSASEGGNDGVARAAAADPHPGIAHDRQVRGPALEAAIRQKANATLLEFWRDRAAASRIPKRGDFDVLKLRPWIGMLSIWDFDRERADYMCRLFSSSETARLKYEMTNRWLGDYPAGIGPHLVRQFDRVRESAAPMLVQMGKPVAAAMTSQAEGLRAEKLLLPLTRSDAEVDCILSQMVFFEAATPAG